MLLLVQNIKIALETLLGRNEEKEEKLQVVLNEKQLALLTEIKAAIGRRDFRKIQNLLIEFRGQMDVLAKLAEELDAAYDTINVAVADGSELIPTLSITAFDKKVTIPAHGWISAVPLKVSNKIARFESPKEALKPVSKAFRRAA